MRNTLKDERGAALVVELVVLAVVLLAGGFALYQYSSQKNAAQPAVSAKPHLTAQASPSPSSPSASNHSSNEAAALVKKLWDGYNANTLSRADFLASSDGNVQAYVKAGGNSDPILCAQDTLATPLQYSAPQVSGSTATVTVSSTNSLGTVRIQTEVDLNSLLVAKITCLPYLAK